MQQANKNLSQVPQEDSAAGAAAPAASTPATLFGASPGMLAPDQAMCHQLNKFGFRVSRSGLQREHSRINFCQ